MLDIELGTDNIYKFAMVRSEIREGDFCKIYSETAMECGFYSHMANYLAVIAEMIALGKIISELSFEKAWALYCNDGNNLYETLFIVNNLNLEKLRHNYFGKLAKLGDPNSHFRYSNIEFCNAILNSYFHDSEIVNEIASKIVEKYKISTNQTIAVYLRATDKKTELNPPRVEHYVEIIRGIAATGRFKILFQSDSESITEEIKKIFNDCIIVEEIRRINDDAGIHFSLDKADLLDDIIKFHSLCSIMSNCKYLICNCSNVSSYIIRKRGNIKGVTQFEKFGDLTNL